MCLVFRFEFNEESGLIPSGNDLGKERLHVLVESGDGN